MIYAKNNYIDRKSQAYVKFKKRSTCDKSLNKKKKEKLECKYDNVSKVFRAGVRKFHEPSTDNIRAMQNSAGICIERRTGGALYIVGFYAPESGGLAQVGKYRSTSYV